MSSTFTGTDFPPPTASPTMPCPAPPRVSPSTCGRSSLHGVRRLLPHAGLPLGTTTKLPLVHDHAAPVRVARRAWTSTSRGIMTPVLGMVRDGPLLSTALNTAEPPVLRVSASPRTRPSRSTRTTRGRVRTAQHLLTKTPPPTATSTCSFADHPVRHADRISASPRATATLAAIASTRPTGSPETSTNNYQNCTIAPLQSGWLDVQSFHVEDSIGW